MFTASSSQFSGWYGTLGLIWGMIWNMTYNNLTIYNKQNHNVRKRTLWSSDTRFNDDSNQSAHPPANHSAHQRNLISVFKNKLRILGYPKCALWRFWSDCANAQAHLIFAGRACPDVLFRRDGSLDVFQIYTFIHYSIWSWSCEKGSWSL